MTTALQIVSRAAELIGFKDPDETLSGNDAANFLAVLNSMVDGWNTDRLFIVASQTVTASVSASPVAIGTGQTLNTVRPIRIEDGWVRLNGIDYRLKWVTSAEYDAIVSKSVTTSLPGFAYYQPSLPSGAIYLWPAPSAAVSLHVRVLVQLSEFAALATEYDLAPGYRKALEYSLAEELAPGRRQLDPQIARVAANARRAIRRTNFEPVQIETSDVARSIVFSILRGE